MCVCVSVSVYKCMHVCVLVFVSVCVPDRASTAIVSQCKISNVYQCISLFVLILWFLTSIHACEILNLTFFHFFWQIFKVFCLTL